jgi:hypothetical protein
MIRAIEATGELRGISGPDSHAARMVSDAPPAAIIDNRTGLPDDAVREAVMARWVETAGLQFGTPTTFQMYAANQGSMLARQSFTTPGNVVDEIKLARQVVDTDDDIQSAIGQALAASYGDGMQHHHQDEVTIGWFNAMAEHMRLDNVLQEMARELLVSSSLTTVSLFTRTRLENDTDGGLVREQMSVPMVGVLPSEDVRVLTNDLFGAGELAYAPPSERMREWLDAYFGATPATQNKMREDQPVLAALFTERIQANWDDPDPLLAGQVVYRLNPRMVHRSTHPKGASAYPRPLLTANFALLEAKRLLNIMDYALLQGGTNYIVIAKQGSDKKQATQPEIDNLMDQVRVASRSGVLVGDHTLDIEIITPKLEELLSPQKRKLIGRKLVMGLLRVPEQVTPDPGNEGARGEMDFISKTLTSDRRIVKRHLGNFVYKEVVTRNRRIFTKGAAKIWFPKIVLSGVKEFYDSVVKARDRGDIPRKWAVEVLGFDYEAGVAQRRRELASGDDEILTPGSVPYDSPDNGPPSDVPDGRPPGSGPNNGRPGSQPSPDPAQRPRTPMFGEAIRAQYSEETGEVVRYGVLTAAVLEQFPEAAPGRVTRFERTVVESHQMQQEGALTVVPLNPAYTAVELRAMRLEPGIGLVLGQTAEGFIVAKALTTREPEWTSDDAVDRAIRWGFEVETPQLRQEAAGGLSMAEVVAGVVEKLDGSILTAFATALGQAIAGARPEFNVHLPEQPQISPPAPPES